jgi:hypothetical protein
MRYTHINKGKHFSSFNTISYKLGVTTVHDRGQALQLFMFFGPSNPSGRAVRNLGYALFGYIHYLTFTWDLADSPLALALQE